FAEERDDDPERLLEAAHEVVARDAEGVVLRRGGATAEAEDEAAAADLVGGRRHLGEERGVAEAAGRDEGAERHAVGRLRQRGEERPLLPGAARLALRDAPVRRVA